MVDARCVELRRPVRNRRWRRRSPWNVRSSRRRRALAHAGFPCPRVQSLIDRLVPGLLWSARLPFASKSRSAVVVSRLQIRCGIVPDGKHPPTITKQARPENASTPRLESVGQVDGSGDRGRDQGAGAGYCGERAGSGIAGFLSSLNHGRLCESKRPRPLLPDSNRVTAVGIWSSSPS